MSVSFQLSLGDTGVSKEIDGFTHTSSLRDHAPPSEDLIEATRDLARSDNTALLLGTFGSSLFSHYFFLFLLAMNGRTLTLADKMGRTCELQLAALQ